MFICATKVEIKRKSKGSKQQKATSYQFHQVTLWQLLTAILLLLNLGHLKADADRMQYHQQGLRDAPSHVSYRFGYDSGDRENPQSRHEVSYEPGYVTGAYSFIDANNKLQYVKYEAHPEHGFRIVDQWTQDANSASGSNSASEGDGRKEDSSQRD